MVRTVSNLALRSLLICLLALACSRDTFREEVLTEIPLDSLDQVITKSSAKSSVAVDPDVSADGQGAIKVSASVPNTVHVAQLDNLGVEDARLIYRAQLRTKDLRGRAYLELQCVYPFRGRYFSRATQSALSGTSDWTSQETAFNIEKGESPRRVELNLVVDGKGTVWIDDIVLAKVPHQP